MSTGCYNIKIEKTNGLGDLLRASPSVYTMQLKNLPIILDKVHTPHWTELEVVCKVTKNNATVCFFAMMRSCVLT